MKYRSLSMNGFEAVQVDLTDFDQVKSHRWLREKPEWFLAMFEKGEIMVTKNSKEAYITLTNKNATFRVFNSDYVIKNSSGLTFWMPEDLFLQSFMKERKNVGLTDKQNAVLQYIEKCDKSPTIRQIMKALNYKSPSVVHSHLKNLKKLGYIDYAKGKHRGIVLV